MTQPSLRQQLLVDDLLDGVSWQEPFSAQGWLVARAHKHKGGQALDLLGVALDTPELSVLTEAVGGSMGTSEPTMLM